MKENNKYIFFKRMLVLVLTVVMISTQMDMSVLNVLASETTGVCRESINSNMEENALPDTEETISDNGTQTAEVEETISDNFPEASEPEESVSSNEATEVSSNDLPEDEEILIEIEKTISDDEVSVESQTDMASEGMAAFAPTMDKKNHRIFANGTPITLEAGIEKSSNTRIKYEATGVEVYMDLDPDTEGEQTEADLSEWDIYGGCEDDSLGTQDNPVNASITINGGYVEDVYGGSFSASEDNYGDTYVTVNGGTVETIYGGGKNSPVVGDTHVMICGGKVVYFVYGGGANYFGSVKGNTHITVTGGTIGRSMYGSGFGYDGDAQVTGDTYIEISGGRMLEDVLGGYQYVNGNTHITVTGGTISEDVCGGALADVAGCTNVIITGGEVYGKIRGDGYTARYSTGTKNGYVAIEGEINADTFDNLLHKVNDTTYALKGSVELPVNMEILSGEALTITSDTALNIPTGVTLTNNGTLTIANDNSITGEGTLTGEGDYLYSFTSENIVVPTDLVADGTDLTETAKSQISMNIPESKQIMGKEFRFDVTGWELSIEPAVVKEPGIYTAIYTKGESAVSKTFVVKQNICDAQVTVSGNYIYDGTEQVPTTDNVIVTLSDNTILQADQYEITADSNRNAGTATVVITAKSGAEYLYGGTVTGEFTIAKKAVTVTAADKTRKYKEANPAFDTPESDLVILEGTLGEGDTAADLAVSLKTTARATSLTGTYPITGSSDSSNYDVTVNPGTLTIIRADASVTIAEDKRSYDFTYGVTAFLLQGITVVSDATPMYMLSDGQDINGAPKVENEILEVSDEGVATIKGSGNVNITVHVPKTDNYNAATAEQTITVSIAEDTEKTFIVSGVDGKAYVYTGTAIKPEPVVYDGATEIRLVKGKDYTVSYRNNTKAYTLEPGDEGFDASKAPSVTITGKGNYAKNLTVYYIIRQKDISDTEVTAAEIILEANGKTQTKVPVLTYNKKKLTGVTAEKALTTTKDFIYTYPALEDAATVDTAFKQPGTYAIKVQGTGNYTGEKNVYLNITTKNKGQNIAKATIQRIPDQKYTEWVNDEYDLTEEALVVTTKIDGTITTLERGTHYTVEYQNHTVIGKATVIIRGTGLDEEGNGFVGTKTATFKINGTSITKVQVTGIKNKVYNGIAQKQELDLTLTTTTGSGNNKVTTVTPLTEGIDYEVIYSKNVNVGTAIMTIKGIGAYTGSLRKTFRIDAYDIKNETDSTGKVKEDSLMSETNELFAKADGELTVKYTKGGCTPEVTLVFVGKTLTKGKDYTVTYSNNKVVTTEHLIATKRVPTIKIVGKGNFKGTIKKTFTITERSLKDAEVPVAIEVTDKVVSKNAGGYISKPVLRDADDKVLKEGTDYEKPVYTTIGENDEIIILNNRSKVEAGKVITVTVTGKGAYVGTEEDNVLVATYRITNKSFAGVKVQPIKKIYTGRKIMLSEEDFIGVDTEGSPINKVTIGTGMNKTELVYGDDFEIVAGSYKDNLKKGTASVILKGKGEYGGTKKISFKIVAKDLVKLLK